MRAINIKKLTKSQLQKIWKQLDGACEAIEKLNEYGGFSINAYKEEADISDLIILKERVESEIEKRTKIKKESIIL